MRTEAQRKADKKYRESGKDKYKTISTRLHIDSIEKLKLIAQKNGLSASGYTARAIFYCANNNIDLSQYDEKLHDPDDQAQTKT